MVVGEKLWNKKYLWNTNAIPGLSSLFFVDIARIQKTLDEMLYGTLKIAPKNKKNVCKSQSSFHTHTNTVIMYIRKQTRTNNEYSPHNEYSQTFHKFDSKVPHFNLTMVNSCSVLTYFEIFLLFTFLLFWLGCITCTIRHFKAATSRLVYDLDPSGVNRAKCPPRFSSNTKRLFTSKGT